MNNDIELLSKLIYRNWKYLIKNILNKHQLYYYDSILCILRSNNKKILDDLKFYKSIFKTHNNSAIFNLR